jgi:hypothetical protein
MPNPHPPSQYLIPCPKGTNRGAHRPKGVPDRRTLFKIFFDKPVTPSMRDEIKTMLGEKYHVTTKYTVGMMVALKQYQRAIANNDTTAAQEILDSMFGKITNKTDVTSQGQHINKYDTLSQEEINKKAEVLFKRRQEDGTLKAEANKNTDSSEQHPIPSVNP